MAYFEGVGGSGGSIVVTCDSEFAGSTISCSDGTNTMTAVCPSVSPYEVEFMVSDSGTYEISATVSGTTYTTEVVVDLELEAALEYGFSWPRWVTYGGLDPSDYEDLADVFSDEAAVRRLMTIHASADYLIDCVTDDVDEIDVFTANDTAMKWIGLRDYVCDGLAAITGVEAKFLASEYWERYLKDHVPTMTSNTTPYGTVSSSNSTNAINVFDQNESTIWTGTSNGTNQYVTYKFTNPVCVKKARLYLSITTATSRPDRTFYVRASNDGTNYVNIGSCSVSGTSAVDNIIDCSTNEQYYLYYQVFCADIINVTNSWSWSIRILQFYGRQLSVSVPVMTSNTAPYGVASASRNVSGSEPYKAFDGDNTTSWKIGSDGASGDYLEYEFTNAIIPKAFAICFSNSVTVVSYKIQGYANGSWEDIPDSTKTEVTLSIKTYPLNNNNSYSKLRIYINSESISGATNYGHITTLQFYGVDYSEREFETGSTKKWLYDHGLELETLDAVGSGTMRKDAEELYIKGVDNANGGFSTNAIDLTDYNAYRGKVGSNIVLPTSTAFAITIRSQKTASGSAVSTNSSLGVLFPNAMGLDISNLNASYYVTVIAQGSTSVFTISELWLE